MHFNTLELALEAQLAVVPLVRRVQRHDRKLAQQLRDATNSFVLNLGEGSHSDPGTRRARYQNAAGSASEVRWGSAPAWAGAIWEPGKSSRRWPSSTGSWARSGSSRIECAGPLAALDNDAAIYHGRAPARPWPGVSGRSAVW